MLLMVSLHRSRLPDLVGPLEMRFDPPIPVRDYLDGFGNHCTRIFAPARRLVISTRLVVNDPGTPDDAAPLAWQGQIDDLPDDRTRCWCGARPTIRSSPAQSEAGK
jgi:hypothetical protein